MVSHIFLMPSPCSITNNKESSKIITNKGKVFETG
jgi:hypothetical protein